MKKQLQNLRKHTNKCFLIFALIFGATFSINAQDIYPQEQYYSLSEPEDVVYYIDWQSFSSITSIVYYYWDEMDEYHEMTITQGSDYAVSGNDLTIYQSFINGMSPEAGDYLNFYAIFDGTQDRHFVIRVIQSYYASIFEDNKNYDLSNPDDVFANIDWATAEEITSVKVGGNELNSSYYYIEGYWLFFTQSYLSSVLTSAGNSITVEVTFDYDYSDEFVINTIQLGVNNATFNPEEFLVDMNGSTEYIETIITWNDASSVESMNVMMVEDEGTGVQVMPYEDYTVTPINASTATLRIVIGGKSASKEIYYFHVSIEVNFNIGEPKYLFLNMYEEFYYVNINIIPSNGGYIDGGSGDYNVDEEVYLEAFPNSGYTFTKWVIDGETEITDNPYTFNMPSHDLDIDAVFMSDYPEVISSNPVNWQNEVDVNTLIYLTYNKNIIEGTSNNGFDDIILTYGGGDPWTINDVYILNDNTLVIVPATPLNINTGYNLNIPPESIEDAANPGTMMNGPYWMGFTTGWGDFQHGEISPEENIYSLMEPGDVIFDIIWGDELSIDALILFYWDQFYEYHEIELNNPNNYLISGDLLTIKNSFISSLSLESGSGLSFYCIFESDYESYFTINVVETNVPFVTPNELNYDLSNPQDLFTVIIYNNAESITSVSRNSTNLTENTDYHILGNCLFINNSYLSPLLQNVSDEITLNVTFNTTDVSQLTIGTIQTGIIDATLDPQFFTYVNFNEPYIDLTITWNDASFVEDVLIWEVDNNELNQYSDFPYTVTPINAETALLRIDVGEKKNSLQTKEIEEFNVVFEVDFNVGSPAFHFATVTQEYYIVYVDIIPVNGGYVDGGWDYYIGDQVELYAEVVSGYDFLCWKINDIVVGTENIYTFEMPANDVYISAHFVPQGADLYTVTLVSNPTGAGVLTGAGEYIIGANVTINAIDNPGYDFVNWTNALSEVVSTNPEYSFVMMGEDVTYTANFNDVSDINSNETDEIEIYPNPFSDILNISNFESVSKITITTVTGQIVAEYENMVDGQINTTDLSNGFYMIILEKADGDKIIRKIIKQ